MSILLFAILVSAVHVNIFWSTTTSQKIDLIFAEVILRVIITIVSFYNVPTVSQKIISKRKNYYWKQYLFKTIKQLISTHVTFNWLILIVIKT